MTVIQVDIEEADKEKHSDSQNVKRDDEKEVSTMKNDESNEYSKAAEVADEKRSQISEHSASDHADDYVTEKSDHHDDEHESRQEHVVHVVSIMFDKTDDDDCLTDVVKKWHEESMQQSRNWMCEMKQSKVTWVSINDVDDIRNSSQWELWELHQSTASDEKTESDNNEQVSCDVELDEWMKNMNADTARSD